MRRIITHTLFVALIFSFVSCDITYTRRMEQMVANVKLHFREGDEKNKTITTIKQITPISYEEMAEEDKQTPEDTYILKAYVSGNWRYKGEHHETDSVKVFLAQSGRVYNMNDTIEVIFDKDYKFLRRKKN